MKPSFKPSNEFRANTEPRARPESSQVNQRAEPRFEPSWDSSKAEPVSKPKPRLRLTTERAQYCARLSSAQLWLSQDEPSKHRPNTRAGPSLNKPEQNPEPRAEPRAEPRTEAEPSLQPSSESRGEPPN